MDTVVVSLAEYSAKRRAKAPPTYDQFKSWAISRTAKNIQREALALVKIRNGAAYKKTSSKERAQATAQIALHIAEEALKDLREFAARIDRQKE